MVMRKSGYRRNKEQDPREWFYASENRWDIYSYYAAPNLTREKFRSRVERLARDASDHNSKIIAGVEKWGSFWPESYSNKQWMRHFSKKENGFGDRCHIS